MSDRQQEDKELIAKAVEATAKAILDAMAEVGVIHRDSAQAVIKGIEASIIKNLDGDPVFARGLEQ